MLFGKQVLDDEVRNHLCPDKLNTNEWLEVHIFPNTMLFYRLVYNVLTLSSPKVPDLSFLEVI